MRHVPGIPHNTSTCVCGNCRDTRQRIVQFGAIRRAAQVARTADRQAFDWMDDPDNERYAMARGIRMAIRAAIRSEKAS